MTNYVLNVLVSGTFLDEQIKEVNEKVSALVKSLGGTLISMSEPARRRLAYVIKKIRNGVYVDVVFSLDEKVLPKLEKELKLNLEIMRFQILKQQPVKLKSISRPVEIKKELNKEPFTPLFESVQPEKPPVKEASKKISMEDLDKKLDEILEEESI